jgi:signal transduction histidine kinase
MPGPRAELTQNMRNRFHSVGNRLEQTIHSIRFRMTLWMIATLAIVLVSYSGVIYYLQYKELLASVATQLDSSSLQLARGYQIALREVAEHGAADLNGLSNLGNGLQQIGDSSTLLGSDGKIIQSFGAPDPGQVAQIANTWAGMNQTPMSPAYVQVRKSPWFNFTHPGTFYIVRDIHTPFSQTGYLLLVSSPIDPTQRLPQLFGDLALGSLGVLLVAIIGSYWLTGRLIAPVRKITRTAQEISGTDLSRRILLNTRDELGELARTFDRMLDRLQGAFDRQRQFTADASHELRTPLTIVDLEATRALEHRRTPEDYERALRVIQSENEFMTGLVNNLLTLARMDAGQAMLKPDRVDLGDLGLEVIERLETLAHEKGVELQAGDLPETAIHGDRQYLFQMLSNLVENAIKYSRPEDGRVCVETGVRENGAGPVGWVKVEDNGPGIPSEAIPHLFDRFYRVDTARSHNPEDLAGSSEMGGSGLGLAIVDWIVRAHGGSIKVSSQVGQGSAFEVELPIGNKNKAEG